MKRPSRYTLAALAGLASVTAVHTLVAPLAEIFQVAGAQPAGKGRAGGSGPDQPVVVALTAVGEGSAGRAVTAAGTLVSNRSVIVRAEAAGRVTALHFSDGARVRAGQVLVSLDDSMQRAELAQAMASASEVEANSRRAEDLLARGFGTRAVRDQARSALNRNQADVRFARERLRQAAVLAPFSGTVGFTVAEVGDYVSAGQEIVNLEDLDPLKLDFRVPETFLAHIRRGAEVKFTTAAYPDRTFTARISGIEPQLDAAGRSVSVRALAANPDATLRPGLFATVNFEADARLAVMIPENALIAEGGAHFVYKAAAGRAIRVPVVIGRRNGALVELVEGGISAGDQVVTLGHEKLRDGAAIRLAGPIAPTALSAARL